MNREIKKEECNKLVVKHNKLIEFKGKMTTNELKLFSLIISDVREQQQKQFEEYEIDISVIKEITKDKNFYDYISEVAFKLESKRIILESLDEEGEKYRTSIRLVNKPKITKKSKTLKLYIDKDLIPYIINLKKEFTRYEIENILKLNSNYSIRLYELLKQYENIRTRKFKLNELKELLGLENQEYSRIYDFEKWVLKVAKKEINNNTDIAIDYEKVKTGRIVTNILFKIEPKDQEKEIYIEYLNQNYNIKEFKLKAGLEKENFNSEQIIELFTIATEKLSNAEQQDIFDYIKINYLHMLKNEAVKNKYAYLKKALQQDYAVARGQIKLNFKI